MTGSRLFGEGPAAAGVKSTRSPVRRRPIKATATSSEMKLQISLRAQEDGGNWVRRLYTHSNTHCCCVRVV